MNVKGGGVSYVNEFRSDEMRMFRGGLRHLPRYSEYLTTETQRSVRNYHDKLNYERGFIQHARSPSNQYFNFHYCFGGFKSYFFDRLFYQTWYRRNIRNWWFPVLTYYILGCIGMRMYDNAAYDYFYFSD